MRLLQCIKKSWTSNWLNKKHNIDVTIVKPTVNLVDTVNWLLKMGPWFFRVCMHGPILWWRTKFRGFAIVVSKLIVLHRLHWILCFPVILFIVVVIHRAPWSWISFGSSAAGQGFGILAVRMGRRYNKLKSLSTKTYKADILHVARLW